MAYFFTETPIDSPTGDRELQRGFLMYGGMDPSGHFSAATALNDLWLYDLSAVNRTDVCRWYEVSTSAGDPLFGGAMVYLEDEREFVIVGGFEDVGDLQTSVKARTLSLDSLASGFTETTLLGNLDYAISEMGAAECRTMQTVTCIDASTCAALDETDPFDPCDPPAAADAWNVAACEVEEPGDVYAACQSDVMCLSGVEGEEYSVSAPGLALSGAAFDPVSKQLTLHGGVTGCMGTCGDWADLFAADLALDNQLLGANAEYRYEIDLSGSTFSATAYTTDMSAYAHADWPSQASVGLHGLSAAAAGQEWTLATREWTHTSTSLTEVVAGGTSFQHLAPSTEDSTECTEYNDCGGCSVRGATSTVTGPEPCADEDSCRVTSPNTMASVSGSGTYSSLGSTLTGVVHPAMIPLDGERVAVIGGKWASEPGGRPDVVVVDVGTGSTEDNFDMNLDRYGSGAVYDPVGRRGYVFAGHDTSSSVAELNFDDRASVNTGEYTVSDYTASLTFTGTSWTAGAAWTQTYSCGSTTCYGDVFWVHVPVDSSSVLSTVDVTVTHTDSSGTARSVTPYLTDTESSFTGIEQRQLTYRLPIVVADGETLAVEVSYEPSPLSETDIYAATDDAQWALRSFNYGPSATPSRGYVQYALPAWPGLGTTPSGAAEQRIHVGEYVFDVPADYTVVAPGTPDDEDASGSVTYTGYEAFWPKDHPVYVLEDVSRVADSGTPYTISVDSGAASVRVFMDDALTAAASQEVEDYVMGGGFTLPYILEDDLQFIVDRLGSPPTTTHNVVYLRAYEGVASDVVGVQVRGSAFNTEFNSAGVITAAGEMASTTIHELTHWYYGESIRFDDARTFWLQEAVPVTIELERYPDNNDSRVQEGHEALYDSHISGSGAAIAPEAIDGSDERRYTVGPYVLSQLFWLSVSASTDFWSAFENLYTATTYGDTVDAATVSGEFGTLVGTSFYPQWVQTGMRGIPLLGITRLDYVGVDPGSAGWAGESVFEYDVQQVQVAMKGWDPYVDVPYTIGCELDDHPGIRPFAQCGADQSVLASSPPIYNMSGNTTVSGTLVGSSDLGTTYAPTPTMIALYRAENLLPGPEYANIGGWTWLYVCGSGDTGMDCLDDNDGDAVPFRGDCSEDTGNGDLIFPFQMAAGENPADGTGIDYNCDQWSMN